MEVFELKQLIEQMGLPVAITSFFKATAPPCIVILPTGTKSSGSDFAAELRKNSYQIELYTARKDGSLEEKMEALLDTRGIHFRKFETYINEEAMYQCAYQVEFYFIK